MKDELEREIIVWLKDGKYRKTILRLLDNEALLSSEIAEKIKTHRSSTSRLLKKLKSYGLIGSTSSSSRTVEYSLTEKGKKYLIYFNKKDGSS